MTEENQHTNPDWQDIFNDASITPPEKIWAGVERALEKQNIWKNAFEDTEIAPSPVLWAKIEEELESKKRKGIVFWLKPSLLKIAATVLLSVVSYQLSMNNNEGQRQKGTKLQKEVSLNNEAQRYKSVMNYERAAFPLAINNKQLTIRQKGNKAQSKMELTSLPEQSDGEISGLINNEQLTINNFTQLIDESIAENDALLSSKSLKLNDRSFILKPEFLNFPEYREPNTKVNKKEYWFAMASGVSPFNPDLDFGGVQGAASTAFMNENIFDTSLKSASASNAVSTNSNNPINESKSGISLQFGFVSGMNLTKKISIETGLQVIKGNSTIVSNTFLIDRETSQKTNIYELATANSTNEDVEQKNVGIISAEQTFQNNYTFLQVPVRIGYRLWQKDRIAVAVLGGTSLDILSTNRLGNTVLNSSDSPYKKLNMSALVGVRANYQVYKNWYWAAGLNYQHAIFQNNKADALLGMKMKFGGINMGLQYKF